MNSEQYVELVEKRLSRNFDIKKDVEILNQRLPLFAKLEVHNERYFGTKNLKIWRAENYEYIFLQIFEIFDEDKLKQFQKFLENAVDYFVDPHREHMSTVITGIIVSEEPLTNLENIVKKYRYRKTYALSMKGWAEVRLIIVHPSSNHLIYNRKGKEVGSFYIPEKKEKAKRFFTFTK